MRDYSCLEIHAYSDQNNSYLELYDKNEDLIVGHWGPADKSMSLDGVRVAVKMQIPSGCDKKDVLRFVFHLAAALGKSLNIEAEVIALEDLWRSAAAP